MQLTARSITVVQIQFLLDRQGLSHTTVANTIKISVTEHLRWLRLRRNRLIGNWRKGIILWARYYKCGGHWISWECKNTKTQDSANSSRFLRFGPNRIYDGNLSVNLVRFSIIEINSMSHSKTTLMAQMELDQLLQFRNLAEESLLLLFPKPIRIDEDCRVTHPCCSDYSPVWSFATTPLRDTFVRNLKFDKQKIYPWKVRGALLLSDCLGTWRHRLQMDWYIRS